MKGRGCCLKLRGARAMLALCRKKEELKRLAFHYLSLEIQGQTNRRKWLPQNSSGYVHGHMPIFDGLDQDKPWVKMLYRYVQGR
jgi:hypothetical protein